MNLKDLNIITYPDQHKHLKDYSKEKTLEVSIHSFDDLFLVAQAKKIFPNLSVLIINYLLGARCDRKFSEYETCDLEIIAEFINSLKFDRIAIVKPHSKKSLELIYNSQPIDYTEQLVQQCIIDNNLTEYSIVSPDKGASMWIKEVLGNEGIIQCDKIRINGEVKSVTFTDIPKEDCIIVDDLCDGGKTFLELSQELRSKGVKRVFLVVTHVIFSKGIRVFDDLIDHIYCTNSYKDFEDTNITQIKI